MRHVAAPENRHGHGDRGRHCLLPCRPVARLVPIGTDAWADLIAAGKVTLASDDADIADEAPVDYGVNASATLANLRAAER